MEWWTGLPWWVRYPIALAFPGFAFFLVWAEVLPIASFPTIGSLCATGFILLVLGPSDSDKNGYNF